MQSIKDWFKNLPLQNVGLSLIAILFIAVAGPKGLEVISNLTKDSSSPASKTSDLTKVNVIVRTKKGSQPVTEVDVAIISKGPPTTKTTDSNGYVEIQIPSRETVEVILSKEGYGNKKYLINLVTDPDTNKTLYIEPVQPQPPQNQSSMLLQSTPPSNSSPGIPVAQTSCDSDVQNNAVVRFSVSNGQTINMHKKNNVDSLVSSSVVAKDPEQHFQVTRLDSDSVVIKLAGTNKVISVKNGIASQSLLEVGDFDFKDWKQIWKIKPAYNAPGGCNIVLASKPTMGINIPHSGHKEKITLANIGKGDKDQVFYIKTITGNGNLR